MRRDTGDKELGRLLWLCRDEVHLSLREVARQTGISAGTISQAESGRVTPRVQHLVALARFYGASLDDLTRHMTPERSS